MLGQGVLQRCVVALDNQTILFEGTLVFEELLGVELALEGLAKV